MRLVIAGAGADGRSMVEQVIALDGLGPEEGFSADEVWSLAMGATTVFERPRSAPHRPLPLAPGALSWRFVRYRAGASIGMHRTDTVDCDVVLDGSITLGLEAGDVALGAGDMVVLPGVAHSWRAGADGCTVSALLVGLAP